VAYYLIFVQNIQRTYKYKASCQDKISTTTPSTNSSGSFPTTPPAMTHVLHLLPESLEK